MNNDKPIYLKALCKTKGDKKVAKEIAAGPTIAYKLMRKLYWDSLENDFETQLLSESKSQTIAGKTEDCFNGVLSFLQKKKVTFKGK